MLPAPVRQALAELLDGRSRRDLTGRAQAITEQYREHSGSHGVILAEGDAIAYAAARMPATYAAMVHALQQLALVAPGLQPQSLMDAGCGPGTAAIAALEVYPVLQSLELFDRNKPFLAIARRLLQTSVGGRTITFSTRDITLIDSLPSADIVTAGYVLAELHESDLRKLARLLWWSTGMALIITEPGTPDGFDRLRTIRDVLLAEGAHVAAPCTHHNACPMPGDAWCRVPVRLQRSRDHRALKGGALGYEDEPVAYLALTREPPAARSGHRIVGPPRQSKAQITFLACGSGEIRELQAPARNPEIYRIFKKLDWGDTVQIPIQESGRPIPD
jgi:ribosomal protein RSM22 (predicted rRNA methylase)